MVIVRLKGEWIFLTKKMVKIWRLGVERIVKICNMEG